MMRSADRLCGELNRIRAENERLQAENANAQKALGDVAHVLCDTIEMQMCGGSLGEAIENAQAACRLCDKAKRAEGGAILKRIADLREVGDLRTEDDERGYHNSFKD